MRRILFMTIVLAAAACAPKPQSPEERAQALISKMNLEEKASLMWYTSAPIEALGIPAYNWWNEALHGVARNGKATTFPQPIGMAASFDKELLEVVFTAASDEARVKNRQALQNGESGWYQGLTFWTPNINIFRDPRWGRGMETYGEDPYLTGQMGMAVVRGLQGPSDAPVLKAHACAKHFAVHSGPEWNRHQFDANVSERDLRETYLPAFKDLVTKADVQEVMIAYNRFRGVPCGANDYLVNTILRGEWGYKGIVVSDCWAVKDFVGPKYHNYVQEPEQAVAAAVHNGTDLECGSLYDRIPDAVARGLLEEADVDHSLTRILAARIRLGELDSDMGEWANLPDSILECPDHLSLARKMAQESLVLLQNKGGILPLKSTEGIALMGPNADDREMLWGNYNPIPEFTVTLADALQSRISGLTFIPGCGIVAPGEPVEAILKKLEGFETVIFAGGISPRLEGEEMKVEIPGFKGGDRTSIELPDVQRELLRALHAAGKKVVLVNFSGSAVGLEPETESCDAILQAWYPGEEGGNAIADVLFGDVVPSGKLPVTFYKSVEQLPDFEDYSMKGRTYRYFEGEPLFPFGFGLGYTTLEYGKPRVKGRRLSVNITNTGDREAMEVVQLYTRNLADTEGPVKSLRGFKRVFIPAGETVRVSFRLTPEIFLSWSEEKQDMVPMEGEWELMVGGSSATLESIAYKY